MPLDAIALHALIEEMRPSLTGAKIDKVQQPERGTVVLSLRGNGERRRLLICAGTGSARIHFTEAEMENPSSPPMFCMLLRKHLTGAVIREVSQPRMDRLAVFDVTAFDGLGGAEDKRLIVEMMGRNSNIVLVGEDGRIIDCLRRAGSPIEGERAVLPGLIYREPPEKGARGLLESAEDEIARLVETADSAAEPERWLMDTFRELSPLVSRELLRRAGVGDGSTMAELGAREREALARELLALRRLVPAGGCVPYMIYAGERPRDFSFLEIGVYGEGSRSERCPSFSALLDEFYTRRDVGEALRRRAADLRKAVKNLRDRRERTLQNQRSDLAESGGREAYRQMGELIKANIYRIKRGDAFVEAENYFDGEGGAPVIRIELDRRKSPQENAAVYFKKYAKLKAAEEHLVPQIERGEAELSYLSSVLDELERAQSTADIAEIRAELAGAGYLRVSPAGRKERTAPSVPLTFRSTSGLEMRVGRNNRQNDHLTFREASKRDIWLHAQRIPGSHVILKCEGREPDEAAIYEAAVLAARHSSASGGKVPVDYAPVKNVRKPGGALPGMVLYTDYKTLIVDLET